MIKKISIENYKSFRKLDLGLQSVNVIIGPNGVGKSSFADLLVLLSKIVRAGSINEAFESCGISPETAFFAGNDRDSKSAKMRIEAWVRLSAKTVEQVVNKINAQLEGIEEPREASKIIIDEYMKYGIEIEYLRENRILRIMDESVAPLRRDGQVKKSRNAHLERDCQGVYHLRTEIPSHPLYFKGGLDYSILSLPLFAPHYPHIIALRRQLKKISNPDNEEGGHMLHSACPFLRREKTEKESIVSRVLNVGKQDFDSFTPWIRDIFPSVEAVNYEIDKGRGSCLKITEGGGIFPLEAMSSGFKRIFALIADFTSGSSETVIVDEPENGLSPDEIFNLAEVLKKLSLKYDKQLIAATHSPIFASVFKDEQIKVFKKNHGVTTLSSFSSLGPLFRMNEIEKSICKRNKVDG